jgi:hypothetical protein
VWSWYRPVRTWRDNVRDVGLLLLFGGGIVGLLWACCTWPAFAFFAIAVVAFNVWEYR